MEAEGGGRSLHSVLVPGALEAPQASLPEGEGLQQSFQEET